MAHLQYIPNLGENANYKENLVELHKSKEANQTRNLKSSRNLSIVKRSFGDISNRVGKNVMPKIEPLKKSQSGKTQVKGTKCTSKSSSPFPEPDFRPEIKEVEDYDDLLPVQYKLSNENIDSFVKFWSSSKKNYDSCPPSPTPSLELISPREYNKEELEFELMPVEDDFGIFELPPPVW
ncbi:hypothetical protein Avbf_14673 [Armadillidium vulgare]|nr:hypothetical protein Avbf_14673 [Armadillidium vulgare]